jgi:hypothetical protein
VQKAVAASPEPARGGKSRKVVLSDSEDDSDSDFETRGVRLPPSQQSTPACNLAPCQLAARRGDRPRPRAAAGREARRQAGHSSAEGATAAARTRRQANSIEEAH